MEIEILTTKKKISKSIIQQLDPAKLFDMEHLNNINGIGYYVRNLGAKYPPVVMIFEGINGWKIIGCRGWRSVDYRPCVEASASEIGSRGTSVLNMYNFEIRDKWIDAYNKTKEICLKNHLIL